MKIQFQKVLADFKRIGYPETTWWQSVRPAVILVGIPLSLINVLYVVLAALRVIPPITVNGQPFAGAEVFLHLPAAAVMPLVIVGAACTVAYVAARVKSYRRKNR